jgi:phosphatidylglycerophosphate synthase
VLLAKILFTVAAAVFHLAFLWGVKAAWDALPAWGFVLALCLYLPPSTFLFYLAGMGVERGRRVEHGKPGRITELSGFVVVLLMPLAMVHNALHNWLPMTVLFLWPSWRPATTMRMNDYADHGKGKWGYHRPLAVFIREHLLNWADPDGIHK